MIRNSWLAQSPAIKLFPKTWYFLRFYFKPIIRVVLSILIPIQIIALIGTYLAQTAGIMALIGWTIFIIASIGGQLWLTSALIYQGLSITLFHDQPRLEALLKISTRYVKPLLVIYIVIYLFILGLAMLPMMMITVLSGNVPGEAAQTIQLFTLFLVFFLVYPRLLLAPFFMIEEELRPTAALRKSNEITRRHRPKVNLIFFGVIFINLIMLLVGLISSFLSFLSAVLVVPFSVFMQMFLYVDLKLADGLFSRETVAEQT